MVFKLRREQWKWPFSAQVPRREWVFSVNHLSFLYWPLSQNHRQLEFKGDTLDTSFNLFLGRNVNSVQFLFFPSNLILFSASVLDNITSSSLSPQNQETHIVQFHFPKKSHKLLLGISIITLFPPLFSFLRANNIKKDKKHRVPNPSMQLSPMCGRGVEIRIPLLRMKYLLVLQLCNFLSYISRELSLKYEMPSWVEVSQTTITWITNILLW